MAVKMGLNFKLDIGTFTFWLQVACQRYRQNSVIAKLSDKVAAAFESVKLAFAKPVAVYA